MKILIIVALAAYLYVAAKGFIKGLKFILSINILSVRKYGSIILKTKWITICFLASFFWPITPFVKTYLLLRKFNRKRDEEEDIKKYVEGLSRLAEQGSDK